MRAGTGLVSVERGLGSDKAAQVEDGLGITAEVPGPSFPASSRPSTDPEHTARVTILALRAAL